MAPGAGTLPPRTRLWPVSCRRSSRRRLRRIRERRIDSAASPALYHGPQTNFRTELMMPSIVRLLAPWALALFALAPLASAQHEAAIALTVDATHSPEHILHVREVLPAQPGALTLYFPKWIPGEHGPDGPIGALAGLHFTA